MVKKEHYEAPEMELVAFEENVFCLDSVEQGDDKEWEYGSLW